MLDFPCTFSPCSFKTHTYKKSIMTLLIVIYIYLEITVAKAITFKSQKLKTRYVSPLRSAVLAS